MNSQEPLGKPQGTVRAYLAFGIVGAFVVGFIATTSVLLFRQQFSHAVNLVKDFGIIAGMVVAFYFGSRKESSK